MDEQMNGWKYWMDAWMYRRLDGWMDKWISDTLIIGFGNMNQYFMKCEQ